VTVVGAAAGALAGRGGGSRPRLAAPGALLMAGGLVVLWWGLGIFRGETGTDGLPRRMWRPSEPTPGKGGGDETSDGGGGGSARAM